MKKMNRVISTLLCAAMLLTCVVGMGPTAQAAGADPVLTLDGVGLAAGQYLASGSKEPTDTEPTGGYAYVYAGSWHSPKWNNLSNNPILVLKGYQSAGDLAVSGSNAQAGHAQHIKIVLWEGTENSLGNMVLNDCITVIEGGGSLTLAGQMETFGLMIVNDGDITVPRIEARSYSGFRLNYFPVKTDNRLALELNGGRLTVGNRNDTDAGIYLGNGYDRYGDLVVRGGELKVEGGTYGVKGVGDGATESSSFLIYDGKADVWGGQYGVYLTGSQFQMHYGIANIHGEEQYGVYCDYNIKTGSDKDHFMTMWNGQLTVTSTHGYAFNKANLSYFKGQENESTAQSRGYSDYYDHPLSSPARTVAWDNYDEGALPYRVRASLSADGSDLLTVENVGQIDGNVYCGVALSDDNGEAKQLTDLKYFHTDTIIYVSEDSENKVIPLYSSGTYFLEDGTVTEDVPDQAQLAKGCALYQDGVLTLDNFDFKFTTNGSVYGNILYYQPLEVHLVGTSNLSATGKGWGNGNYGLFSSDSDPCGYTGYYTAATASRCHLQVTGQEDGVLNITDADTGFYFNGLLHFESGTVHIKDCDYGIRNEDAAVIRDDFKAAISSSAPAEVVVSGGTLKIDADNYGIWAESGYGGGLLEVTDGELNIKAEKGVFGWFLPYFVGGKTVIEGGEYGIHGNRARLATYNYRSHEQGRGIRITQDQFHCGSSKLPDGRVNYADVTIFATNENGRAVSIASSADGDPKFVHDESSDARIIGAPTLDSVNFFLVTGENHSDFQYLRYSQEIYDITFDGGGAAGGVNPGSAQCGYVLPENGFTPAGDQRFAGWLVGDLVYQPGDTIYLGRDTTIYPCWVEHPSEAAGQYEGYYEIHNAGELLGFAELVSNGETDANAILRADIDLQGIAWTPIGGADKPYTGTFAGGGYTVSGLNVGVTKSYGGMFGNISNAAIQDLTVDGDLTIAIPAAPSDEEIGPENIQYNFGLVGYASGTSKILNVHSSLDITVTTRGQSRHVGGVVGRADGDLTVSGCVYDGSMDLDRVYTDCAGGILAYASSQSTVTIQDCAFYGAIRSSYRQSFGLDGEPFNSTPAPAISIGGIMGYFYHEGMLSIRDCVSAGDIVVDTADYSGTVMGRLKALQIEAAREQIGNNYYEGGLPVAAELPGSLVENNFVLARQVTNEQLASGEIAIALGEPWGQRIGVDPYPLPGGWRVIQTQSGGYENTDQISGLLGDQRTAEVSLTEAGRYLVIFADYEETGRLAAVNVTEFTTEVSGLQRVTAGDDITLGGGDKVFLLDGEYKPLCPAYTVPEVR